MSYKKIFIIVVGLSLVGIINLALANSFETVCPNQVTVVNDKIPDSLTIGGGLNLLLVTQPIIPQSIRSYSFTSVQLSQGIPPYFNALSCWYQAGSDEQNIIGYAVEEGIVDFNIEGNNWKFTTNAASCVDNTTVCPFDINSTR
ncbi:MAG: hypothetical protein A3E87_09530 [Gammaproteobacteria bacterium RIFCSPHIGHO2_12_FULL_35_23]|nr:MAG: hypothetical protein A3E87_09530 [Gammaproteobacteria bacterium RIFCSPHIGHO2_12_FULL_35_23]